MSALVQVLPMGAGVPFRLNGSEDCDRSHAEHGPPEDAFWRDALRVSASVQVLPMGVGLPFWLNGSEDCVRGHAEHGPPVKISA